MRKKVLTLFFLFNSVTLIAQKDLPSYGKIEKSDLLLKECEFDKDAEAYKLISYGYVHYDIIGGDFNIITERRTRIKILKDKGLEEANIKIRFYSKLNLENIKGIAGVTYNLDNSGKITTTKLEKSSIYIKKITNQFSEVSFTLPDVKVGSVFEYKFIDERKSIGDIDDWYFQDDIPIRTSRFRITIPSLFRFVTKTLAYQEVKLKSETVRESVIIGGQMLDFNADDRVYNLDNVPALREEPHMGAAKDYLQRLVFQLSEIVYLDGHVQEVKSTWPKLTKELLEDEDFGLQLKRNLPHTSALDDSLKKISGDYNKMVAIHDYVRRNMNWNGHESIYSMNGIRAAWDKKSGTNSELNFILIDLLRDAGLKAYPLLVSTKDNGTVNTLYPFLEQFNNTMALVMVGDRRFVLNAADKYNPSYMIPYDVLDNEAFIVDPQMGGWITLTDQKDSWKNVVYMVAKITPEKVMTGNATVYSYGYSKNPKVKEWDEKRSRFKEHFTKNYVGLKIDSIAVTNEDIDTLPLKQKFDFSLPLNSSGVYQYFTINLFQGNLDKNPFVADERKTDIDFNYKQNYAIAGKISIPEGYEFEELPKNIKMIMPDSSITLTRIIQKDKDAIDFRVTLDFAKSFYPSGSYLLLQEFYKKLFTTLNEQIVIKKKNGNA